MTQLILQHCNCVFNVHYRGVDNTCIVWVSCGKPLMYSSFTQPYTYYWVVVTVYYCNPSKIVEQNSTVKRRKDERFSLHYCDKAVALKKHTNNKYWTIEVVTHESNFCFRLTYMKLTQAVGPSTCLYNIFYVC